MKFEETSVWGFKHAIRGMRNPKKSWSKSDSFWKHDYDEEFLSKGIYTETFIMGLNDMKLATSLKEGGSEHRKFLRQIFVSVDITAPLYFWKEYDTYKINTTANSTSTMHTLATESITLDCFEIDDLDMDIYDEFLIDEILRICEQLRLKYLETKEKKYWKELIRWLPDGWLQLRTVTLNYENLSNIYHQRKNHKLNEWSGLDDNSNDNFMAWIVSLPYAKELITD